MFLKTRKIFSAAHRRKCPWVGKYVFRYEYFFFIWKFIFRTTWNCTICTAIFSVLDRRSERIFVSGNKRSDTEVINEMPVIACAHMLSYMKDYFYIEQFLYGNQQSIKQHYLKTSWRKSWPALTVFGQLIQKENFRSSVEFILIQDINHQKGR
jgi:hypothetical protein